MSMATHPDYNLLTRLPLFVGLTPDEVARLGQHLHYKTVRTGTNIIAMAQPGEAAYLLLTGTVKIYLERADGTSVVLAILGAGEIIGELSVVDRLGRSATVVTLEETHLAWLDRATLDHYLQTFPLLAYNLVRVLSHRLRLADAQIEALAALDLYGRVARQLIAFAEEYGQPAADGAIRIPLRLTQSDLADLVGASRVRVNRVLGDFRQLHYITLDPDHHIVVHNLPALAARCG
jgi:CRP/FNR family cyclic AMP-dependent transcriptional regulator